MPSKIFELDDGLTVAVYKHRASRHLRLSITSEGQARVSIPTWAPYRTGLEFARARQGWIRDHSHQTVALVDGQAIGKAHHLVFESAAGINKPTGRVLKTSVLVRYPITMNATSPEVQKEAVKTCVRALRLQAQQLLPKRLDELAKKHQLEYSSVGIKQLKRRWGSCDQQRRIILNLFLMQLPWELIDYVLLHELTHTIVLRHGSDFWQAMDRILPANKQLRRQLRDYQPQLG